VAQLLHSTRFKSPTTAAASFSVTIPATATGSTLVCVAGGGATIQAKLGGTSGTNFTKRTNSLNNREVVAQDIVDAGGGTTSIGFALNGPENIDGIIFEFAAGSLGSFIAGANEGGASITSDGRAKIGSVTTTGPAVLFTMFTSGDTSGGLAGAARKFWGLEPLGKQFANDPISNDPTKSLYWSMIGVSDQSSAGTFIGQSSRITASGEQQSVMWAYQDLSGGVPTYANPYPNAIAAENSLPGSLNPTWFVAGSDAVSGKISGYTDSMSYKPGDTVNFKVDSAGANFNVEIVRLGFYGFESFSGRAQATVAGTVVTQPAPTVNSYGGTECAWTTNATWAIPTSATTGVYAYILRRTDVTTYIMQGLFVVNPSIVPANKSSGIMLTMADLSWQAYNVWGGVTDGGSTYSGYTGRSLYGAAPNLANSNRAFAVSYDRPMGTAAANSLTYFWDSEAGLVNFLEGNGYDVSYYTMVDIDKNTAIPSKYTTAISQGHSEYWTVGCRDAFENARDGGTNLMFLTSNTALWHVRFNNSDTNRRLMICYKDSHNTTGYDNTTKYDPVTYTGTWRDARTTVGGVNNTNRRPESAMTGLWFIGNGTFTERIAVPDTYKNLPIWRNTRVASNTGISVVGSNTNAMLALGTATSIDQPSSTQVGDLLIITLVFNGVPTSFNNGGFKVVSFKTADSTNITTVVLQEYAANPGVITYNFSWSGQLMSTQAILVYRNAVWEDSSASVSADTSGNATHATLATPNGGTGRWAVCMFADVDSTGLSKTTSWTAGAGLASRAQANNASGTGGPWSSLAVMDTNGAVTAGTHQYSATAQFANPHAGAVIMYISPGTTLYANTIGAEWDYVKKEEPTTPANMVMLSRQVIQLYNQRSNYNGNDYGGNGTLFYGMSLYKASSGALVFNTGSWRYQWGISRIRGAGFNSNDTIDVAMQQALINLLKDFGHDAATLLDAVANNDSTALVNPGAAATAADYGLTLTASNYQSIFDATTVPQNFNAYDSTDYNLGTLFSSDTDGTIYGARWYFPDGLPDQPVVATLYSWTNNSTGTVLATATFANPQQGWNDVLFSSPVAMTANTKYVVAVWTSDRYTSILGLFASAGITSGHLTAPQDTAGAHNGKYINGSGGSAYPSNSTNSNGYLADVLYVSSGTISFEGWGIPIN
jgi:hypothetical protein